MEQRNDTQGADTAPPATHSANRAYPWAVALFVLVAAAALFLATAPRPYSASLIGMHDSWMIYGPTTFFVDYSLRNGELPLWNPLLFCGTPLAANPQTGLFYPPHLLRSLFALPLTPFTSFISLTLMVWIHAAFAGMGIFAFSRAHRLSTLASLASVIAFVFCAPFIRHAFEQWVIIASVAWLPWLLLLVKKALDATRSRQTLRLALLAGVLFGIGALPGYVQTSAHMAVAAVAYACFYTLSTRTAGPPTSESGVPGARLLGVLAVLFGAALLTAAVMILPAWEFAQLTSRIKGSGVNLGMGREVHGFLEALRYLIVYPGAPKWTLDFRAAGAVVFFLACAAVILPRRKEVWLFGALFLVLIDCAIGPPMPVASLLKVIVPFQMSHAGTALVACFPLAILAGLGVDAVAAPMTNKRSMLVRQIVLASCGIAIALTVARAITNPIPFSINYVVAFFPVAATIGAVALPRIRRPRLGQALLLVLLAGELVLWNREYVPHLLTRFHWQDIGLSVDALQRPRSRPLVNRRAAVTPATVMEARLVPAMNGADPLQLGTVVNVLGSPFHEGEYMRHLQRRHVTAENSRGNLFPKRLFWLARAYSLDPLPGKSDFFPVASLTYLDTGGPPGIPNLTGREIRSTSLSNESVDAEIAEILASSLDIRELEAPASDRRAFALGPISTNSLHGALFLQYHSGSGGLLRTVFRNAANDPGETRLTADGRDFGFLHTIEQTDGSAIQIEVPWPSFDTLTAIVDVELDDATAAFRIAGAYAKTDPNDEDALIEIRSLTANTAEVELTDLPGPRILSFIDADYPGWKAYIDGEPVSIYRANGAFKAVAVPPGSHTLRFEFRPWRVYAGMAISLCTLVGTACVLVLTRPRAEG